MWDADEIALGCPLVIGRGHDIDGVDEFNAYNDYNGSASDLLRGYETLYMGLFQMIAEGPDVPSLVELRC